MENKPVSFICSVIHGVTGVDMIVSGAEVIKVRSSKNRLPLKSRTIPASNSGPVGRFVIKAHRGIWEVRANGKFHGDYRIKQDAEKEVQLLEKGFASTL